MALDHGPRHSMTCVSRFWLSRPVDRDAFAAAVAAVAAVNPFLAVRRRGASWRRVAFTADTQIDWNDAATPVACDHLPPDDTLVRWAARVGRLGDLGVEDPDCADTIGTLVVIRYPHSVADGLAAAAAMRQVVAELAGQRPAPPTEGDLAARITPGCRSRARRVGLRHELWRIVRYFSSQPAAFAAGGTAAPANDMPGITFERRVLPTGVTSGLLDAARAAGVTLNDVLVAALHRALASFMSPRDVVRIAVPVSLRPRENLAFCNQVSMVFLDRTAARIGDPELLRGIAAEMGHVKRWRLGHAMHSFLAAGMAAGDTALAWFMRLPLVSTTAVLSNLGDPFGEDQPTSECVRVVAHDLMSPLRPGTNIALGVARHDGRLSFTLRFAPDRVPDHVARTLLERLPVEAAALLAAETGPTARHPERD